MTQSIAVAASVANQLHHEGRWPPNNLNKVMGGDYHYDKNTLALFLSAVKWNLENGYPSYKFDFDAAFVALALNLSVGVLIGAINSKTTDS